MGLKDFPDRSLMTPAEVLNSINTALFRKKAFSLVRIGDGENIVLAQNKLMSIPEVMNSYWVRQSESGKGKGVTLPNLALPRQMIKAIRKADIVGICRLENDEVSAPSRYKRKMTNKLFDLYQLHPSKLCHVFVNRKMVSHPLFWKMLHQYRTLLISKWWEPYAEFVTKQYPSLKPNIIGGINFTHYDQIPAVLTKIKEYHYDLVLISAGVNAVILAPAIAEQYGKVAIDFGKTMMYTVRPCSKIQPWKPRKKITKTLV